MFNDSMNVKQKQRVYQLTACESFANFEPFSPASFTAFGGFKMSDYGRKQGAEVLESYTQYKTVWANLGE